MTQTRDLRDMYFEEDFSQKFFATRVVGKGSERSHTAIYRWSRDRTHKFRIIDCHSHSYLEKDHFTYKLGHKSPFEGTSEELLTTMDAAGIEKTVIVAHGQPTLLGYMFQYYGSLEDSRRMNDQIARAVAIRPDRLIGFAKIPLVEGEEVLNEVERAIKVLRFRGIGHYKIELAPLKITQPVIEKAAELGVPIETASGALYKTLRDIAPSYPDVKFKASDFCSGHLHVKELVEMGAKTLTENPNVWTDVSGVLAMQPERCVSVMKEIGFDKFVYGSDFPVINRLPEHEINLLLLHSELQNVPQEEVQKVLWDNAANILGQEIE